MSEKGGNDKLMSKKMESQLPIVKEYSHDELLQMSTIYSKSGLAPSHLKTPEAVYIAMRWAIAIRIDPFMGLRDIFVIDNIPTLKTEAALALVESSGFLENIEQEFTGNPYDDNYTAICKVKRKGRKEHVSTFSVKDAKDAKLWGKKTKTGQDTAWITYKRRMLMYRSVGFALRDIFADVLRGAKIWEEVVDYAQFEIVEDKSTDDSINVTVQKSHTPYSAGNKMRDVMSDEPPTE